MPPGGEPQIVEEAKYRPGRCLASGDTEGPFIDCGRWTREHDPYLQLSVRWFEETARDLLGMVSRAEVDERYAELEKELIEQAEELGKLDQLVQAATGFEKALEMNGLRNVVESTAPASDPAKAEFSQDDAERERIEREAGGVAA
jgi:hypothetical protein